MQRGKRIEVLHNNLKLFLTHSPLLFSLTLESLRGAIWARLLSREKKF